MDADMATRFIASLSKSLQAVIHGCLDFEQDIELGGYVFLKVDNAQRIDYVLNEKMQKSDLNSMIFHSNSFHALPQSTSDHTQPSKDKSNISANSTDFQEKSVSGGRSHSRSDTESPMFSMTQSAVGSKISNQTSSSTNSRNPNSFMQPKSDFQKFPSSSNRSAAASASDSFNSNRSQSLTDFQTAFRSQPTSHSNQSQQSSSANSWSLSHNGSSSRTPSGQPLPQQSQQQNRSSILPDASDMEVVHIKTEDEDDVFNIPLQCQQGGSESESKEDLFQSLLPTSAVSPCVMQSAPPLPTNTTFLEGEPHLNWVDSHLSPTTSHCKVDNTDDSFQFQTLMQPSSSHASTTTLSASYQYPQTLPRGAEPASGDMTKIQSVVCGICNHFSISQKSHARHMTLRHFRSGDFACGECGKMFQTKLYLNQHMKSHGERKYACEVCGQKFLYKHHLPRHQQAVHGAVTCYNVPQQSDEHRDDLPVMFEHPS